MQDDERRRLADEPSAARASRCPTGTRAGLGRERHRAPRRSTGRADGPLEHRRRPAAGHRPSRLRHRGARRAPARGRHVLDTAAVIVCCGSGGVGKTTTAAVIGLEAARRGRRVVVVTIDPARRLADALGLADGLAAEPQRIELVASVPGTDVDRFGGDVGDDARRRGDLRRPRPPRTPRAPRSDRRDPVEPVLQEHRRCAERDAGVHGRRGAPSTPHRRTLRPGRGRHAAEPQRTRFPRGARRAAALPRPQGVQADDAADQGRLQDHRHGHPAVPAGDRQGGRFGRAGRLGRVLPGVLRDGGRIS